MISLSLAHPKTHCIKCSYGKCLCKYLKKYQNAQQVAIPGQLPEQSQERGGGMLEVRVQAVPGPRLLPPETEGA